jgi:hypothetical protein
MIRCKDCVSVDTKTNPITCNDFGYYLAMKKSVKNGVSRPYCRSLNRTGECQQYERKWWKFWRKE